MGNIDFTRLIMAEGKAAQAQAALLAAFSSAIGALLDAKAQAVR